MNISSHWQTFTALPERVESTRVCTLTGFPILRSAGCPTIERACYYPSPGSIRIELACLINQSSIPFKQYVADCGGRCVEGYFLLGDASDEMFIPF